MCSPISLSLCLSPQNALLPAGLRQKDQTTKQSTGKFNRDDLLKYLEKEALEYKDKEDIVPFTGEKKGLRDLLKHSGAGTARQHGSNLEFSVFPMYAITMPVSYYETQQKRS